jgi:SAM-dependent methyltransferase
MTDATQRFSSRVEDYVRSRPGYPAAMLEVLATECGLGPESIVADVGSGTGLLTAPLLERVARVYAVEPNADMRAAAEAWLGGRPGFVSIAGTAEATTLAASSVDLVTAGQAFHWFEPQRARAEFSRILRPGGWVALAWNERLVDVSPFLRDYEAMLRDFGTDYDQVDHRQVDDAARAAFFGPGGYRERRFPNRQDFDLAGAVGRLRSSSYTPEPGDPRFEPMMRSMAALFERHQVDGRVAMLYETQLFYGRLDG